MNGYGTERLVRVRVEAVLLLAQLGESALEQLVVVLGQAFAKVDERGRDRSAHDEQKVEHYVAALERIDELLVRLGEPDALLLDDLVLGLLDEGDAHVRPEHEQEEREAADRVEANHDSETSNMATFG